MIKGREKISLKQALFLYLTITFSPTIRFSPTYTATVSKQACWLTPFASMLAMFLIVLLFHRIYARYQQRSFSCILYDILGRVAGRTVLALYCIWIILLLALYTRYYAERIVSTLLPSAGITIFIITLLATVSMVLRSGIEVLARMNEIFLFLIFSIIVILFIFNLGNTDFKNFLPVSYLDIVPVLKGSMGISAILGYLVLFFFIGDQINDKEHIKKLGVIYIGLAGFINIIAIATVTGSLGYSFTRHLPIPYFTAIRQISLLNTVEHFESALVALWIFADFTLISSLTYIMLKASAFLFGLSHVRPLINPLLLNIFLFSLYLSSSRFELADFSKQVMLPLNLVFEFIIPVVVFTAGKIRGKI
jgi:spore germination protein (amino acid permease)